MPNGRSNVSNVKINLNILHDSSLNANESKFSDITVCSKNDSKLLLLNIECDWDNNPRWSACGKI